MEWLVEEWSAGGPRLVVVGQPVLEQDAAVVALDYLEKSQVLRPRQPTPPADEYIRKARGWLE